MIDTTEKVTETEFINKIHQFYAKLQARWGYPIQPMRMNLKPNTPRLEFMFQSVMSGHVCYIWFNGNTGMAGWSVIAGGDVL